METARSRFLRYVTYYTTSDEHTGTSPSTERQKDLGRVLLAELTALGPTDGRMDSAGNVIATLPAPPASPHRWWRSSPPWIPLPTPPVKT